MTVCDNHANFFFLNQQFIIWSIRADHSSYFITTYKISKLQERKNRKERKKEQEEKKRKRNDKKMKQNLERSLLDHLNYQIALLNAKTLLLNLRKRMK